ncbi:MAG: hypothetical protein AB8B72_10465 [Crocinitomicaceae bacterium]
MKNQSKAIKNIIASVVMLAIAVLGIKYMNNSNLKYFIMVPVIIFGFNFLVRSIPSFKPYFISPLNFLSGKTLIEKQLDLPKGILVEKFSEVLSSAGFKLIDINKDDGTLFATSGPTWKSWGDNIYIEFDDNGAGRFYSVSVLGVYSWGNNDCNLRRLANSFESSLTI